MVDFNTRIFNEDDGKIIGAEITVYSDSGNKIGSISVADATTLAEMQAQLAVIDETYFTEERLAAILSNINESQEINATKLSGFLSSDFAKVSQLSNYAPLNHNHSVSQITGLYDYQITASSYNVDIDSDVTITVKVTNRATGQPVVGVNVPVLKNNETWQSGTTGVNGTFSLTYTADTWGLVMFSVNNNSILISVVGWKQVIARDNSKIVVYKNNNQIKVTFNGTFTVVNGSGDIIMATIPTEYAPDNNVVSLADGGNKIVIGQNGDIKHYKLVSDSSTTKKFNIEIEYSKQN